MPDIKKNENNKEKKSQDKKLHKSGKLLELLKQAKENKQQPDQVANGKKAILGKKIKKLSKDHTYPDSLKNASATALFGEKLSDKKSIPESDIEIIINNIDWDKLKKSCADFYVNVTRNNPFKIYLRIIKNPMTYLNSKILVKYINNIGFWKEEKLELKHVRMYHSLEIAELYLKNNIIHKLTTKGRIVKEKIVEDVERITYPKILLYLNTFTYCEVTKRINHAKKGDLGKNVKEERNLEDLKNIVEEWFSENRYNIPCDTECLSSLNLLNEADSERRKTSEAVEDDLEKEVTTAEVQSYEPTGKAEGEKKPKEKSYSFRKEVFNILEKMQDNKGKDIDFSTIPSHKWKTANAYISEWIKDKGYRKKFDSIINIIKTMEFQNYTFGKFYKSCNAPENETFREKLKRSFVRYIMKNHKDLKIKESQLILEGKYEKNYFEFSFSKNI